MKNQDYNPIDDIISWNKERGLDTQEYNSLREFGFILEELLEGIGVKDALYSQNYTKEQFRELVKLELDFFRHKYTVSNGIPVADIKEQADAFGDLIVFAVGALLKICNANPELGSPSEILEKIMVANHRKGDKLDADGKIIKDITFIEPEL